MSAMEANQTLALAFPFEHRGTRIAPSCLRNMKNPLPTVAIAATLAACSPEQLTAPDNESGDSTISANATDTITGNMIIPTPVASSRRVTASNLLMLEGLGDLRIGQPIPANSTWSERGAQASDTCRTISSPDFPGVYAIMESGKVRRITAGHRSTVRLAENIGVGSTEKEVLDWFAGFRAEPHEYADAPAKYLTAPNAASGNPALRFEIGEDRKVSLIHVGTMPVLGYVEGCA